MTRPGQLCCIYAPPYNAVGVIVYSVSEFPIRNPCKTEITNKIDHGSRPTKQ